MTEKYRLTHLNIGGQLHLPSDLTRYKYPRRPMNRGAYLATDAIKTSKEEKKILILPKNPKPGPPARSLVSKLTELTRIPSSP